MTDGQDVEMVAGDSRTLIVSVSDSEAESGIADLTGCSARWWLTRTPRSPASAIFLQKTSEGSGGISVSAEGVVTITLDPEDTEDLTPGLYYHECEVRDQTGGASTIMSGALRLRPGVIPPA